MRLVAAPTDTLGIAVRLAPFAAAAVLAFLVVLPEGNVRMGEYGAAAGLACIVAAAVVLTHRRRVRGAGQLVPSLLFLVSIFLLRDSAGASTAGIGIVALLPVFWQALYGSRDRLAVVTGALTASFALPVALIGPPAYPLAQLRMAALFGVVAAFVGYSAQALVAQVRREAERSRCRERDLERIAAIARSLPASEDARHEICVAARELSGGSFAVLLEPDGRGRLVATAAAGIEAGTVSIDPEHVERGVWEAHGRPGSIVSEPVVRGEDAPGVLVVAWEEADGPAAMAAAGIVRLLAAEAGSAIERADLLARLASMAVTDALTGLPNRRALEARLERSLRESAARELCVAMLDLDRFKDYNDRHGHQAGDRVLRTAAAAWRDTLRPRDLLARYGGEEFAVVLEGSDGGGAVAAIERLRAATPDGQTCSGGIAIWDGREDAEALVRRADRALYAAKEAGRDRAVVDGARPAPRGLQSHMPV